MSENFDEILSAALSLSPGARAMLADHLLESLDNEDHKRSDPSKIVVQPQTEGEYTLEELLAGKTRANLHGAVNFGPPVGKEGL